MPEGLTCSAILHAGRASLARTLLLALVVLEAGGMRVHALTPLGGWQSGFATFYGGAPDGDSPYSPSFGTLDVRAAACTLSVATLC